MPDEQRMKGGVKDVRKCGVITSVLILLGIVVLGGCATSQGGPVPVKGMVTGRYLTPPAESASGDSEKEKPHYFLWVKTENGLVLVEVKEEEYQEVTEGQHVCINCD